MNLLKSAYVLVALTALAGCTHNVREASGFGVGQVLQPRSALAVRPCEIFTSRASLWTPLKPSLCLTRLRTDDGAPPHAAVLDAQTRLKVTRISEVNGIDFVDTVIHLRDESSGTTYVMQTFAADSAVDALRPVALPQ